MRTLIAGYRPYELGIFKPDQKEVTVLKAFLKQKAVEYIENGTEWFIIQGYNGIDMYAAEVINELKAEHYDIKLAVLMPFYEFNERYNAADAESFQSIIQESDFHDYIFKKKYDSPQMFKKINYFLISHTDQAIIMYDESAQSKVRFLYEQILEFREDNTYTIERIDFDEINTFVESSYDS